MLLFRSEEHARSWRDAQGFPDATTISVETGWRLAHAWYARKLQPDWRRHTLEEAETLFASLGLGGEFWRLRA